MKIKSIVEMDNGVKYCASSSIEDTAYEIKLAQQTIYLQVVCLVIDDNNILQTKESGFITTKPVILNVDHIVSIRPTNIDLTEGVNND